MRATHRLNGVIATANRAILTWATSLLLLQASQARAVTPALEFAEGELLVKFADGPLSAKAQEANAHVNAKVLRTFRTFGWQHVRLPQGMTVPQGLAAYATLPGVLAAEPNYRAYPAGGPPDDPHYAAQWALERISVSDAWTLATGSEEVVVAVIDTGIRFDHEDLVANMWRNPGETGLDGQGQDKATNGVDDDQNGYADDVFGIDALWADSVPDDEAGHGTMVAGIIGATGNNRLGMTGVNWHVKLMALKWMNADVGFTSGVLECLDYVIKMKQRGVNIRVTNNSYAIGTANVVSVGDAMEVASGLGILHACAASNAGWNTDTRPVYPASYMNPGIISVAASDPSDARSVWSFGSSNYGSKSVDLAAPGSEIQTTSADAVDAYRGVDGIDGFNGTSAATPFVAGTAALLASLDPSLTTAEIKAAILGTVDVLPAWANYVVTGGRLNAGRAALEVVAPDAPSIVLSVSPTGGGVAARNPLVITFSKPMEPVSTAAALHVSPLMDGTLEWSNLDRTLTFHPSADWRTNASVRVTIAGTALDQEGSGLDGNFNRLSEGARTDDFQWTFSVPPQNDNFADAILLAGEEGQTGGDNTRATTEEGEPRHAGLYPLGSVWWRWTAPVSQPVIWDTLGSAFRTSLAVYSGERLDELVEIASNRRYLGGDYSRLWFRAEAGTTYALAVSGEDETGTQPVGAIRLNWRPGAAPEINGFQPSVAVVGARLLMTGSGFEFTTRVLLNQVEAEYALFGGSEDTRMQVTVPVGAQDGLITVLTPFGSATAETPFTLLVPNPLPSVTLARGSGNQATLTWPIEAADSVLESADDLSSSPWVPVPGQPGVVGNEFSLAIELGPGTRFFRLRHP